VHLSIFNFAHDSCTVACVDSYIILLKVKTMFKNNAVWVVYSLLVTIYGLKHIHKMTYKSFEKVAKGFKYVSLLTVAVRVVLLDA